MLKQPTLSVLQTAPSAGCSSVNCSNLFALNSSIFFRSFDSYPDNSSIDYDDDSSVTSLESFTSPFSDDTSCLSKTCRVPTDILRMPPGTYWEKSKNSRLPKMILDSKPDPTICYLRTSSSPSHRKEWQSSKTAPLSRPLPSILVTTSPKTLDSSFSSVEDPRAEIHLLPVATPISATRVVPCCDLCGRKDAEIHKQAKEIESLKGLVTQLVAVLGQSVAQQNQQLVVKQQDQVPSQVIPTSQPQPPVTLTSRAVESHQQETQLTLSIPPASSPCSIGKPCLAEPECMSKRSSSSTMLRLSRLKQLKEESSTVQPRQPRKGKRHLYVSVAGNWGYYSGPVLEQNISLQGCVIRFDNGDLYLGDMMCYVPSTSFFSDEHGLLFHGRGTLYRKDGCIIRGLFHKHQLIE